jgi:large subunit ribosomal protein L18
LSSKRIQQVKDKRKKRVRGKIFGTGARPRLSVFRSSKHIYVQAINDQESRTLVEASTLHADLRGRVTDLKKQDAAREVGKLVASRLMDLGVRQVIFDRGAYLFHGRVKALADAAREAGLDF